MNYQFDIKSKKTRVWIWNDDFHKAVTVESEKAIQILSNNKGWL